MEFGCSFEIMTRPSVLVSLLLLLLLFLSTLLPAQQELSYQSTDTARFVAAHGRSAWIGGYPKSGLEVWAGPVQIASGVQVALRREGEATDIPGATMLRKLTYTPAGVRMTYVGPDFTVEQSVVTAPTKPAVRISFVVHSLRKLSIIVRFRPSLNLMWPAAAGGQDISWDPKESGYVLTEPLHRFSATIIAPGALAHDEVQNSAFPIPSNDALAITLNRASPEIVFAGSTDPAQVRALLAESPQWEQQNAVQEAHVIADELQVETPDPELNRALASAEVALDEAWQCSDQLGCGYVAGYGPSRRNRRPQYAWFFAGDGIINMRAALAAGDFERARDELKFIAKYQDAQTGMIWHELTLSAPYINWRSAYPYMFVHADITFAYIPAIEEYVRTTGDQNFLQQIWPSVEKAFSYCRGLVSSDDGLPHIPPGQQGGDEQDQLTDELSTSASWVSATEAYAHLAQLAGHGSAALQARQMGERARQSIATHYWSAQHNFWIQGHLRNGAPMESRSSGSVETITEHLFTQPQIDHALQELASWRFQSDWGTRSIALGESAFDPNSYGKGSVWGLGTADMAEAFWATHRPLIAWQIWRTLPPWSSLDSMGHMHEVLAGDTYHPQLESVPEQTWSSAAFLSTFVHGLLGIEVDSERKQLTFAPHLPADWNGVHAQHIRAGASFLDLALTQSVDSIRLRIVNHGAGLHFVFDPELPMSAKVLAVTLNGKKVRAVAPQQNAQDLHEHIELELPPGESQIELTLRDGVALAFDAARPSFGDISKAMKPISVQFEGDTLTVQADVVPGEENKLRIFTMRKLLHTSEGTARALAANQYEVALPKSSTKADYERRQIVIQFSGSTAQR